MLSSVCRKKTKTKTKTKTKKNKNKNARVKKTRGKMRMNIVETCYDVLSLLKVGWGLQTLTL